MPADPAFWIALAVKMAVTAVLVIAAARIAERAGALAGSLVATLPLSTGPAYAFLALEHDAAFLAQSALTSLACNAAILVFAIVYSRVAQRFAMPASLAAALAAWLAFALAAQAPTWSMGQALLVNAVAFAVALPLVRPLRHTPMPRAPRRWYDTPTRALLVASLIGAVLILGHVLGPRATGALAVFPVVFTSLILILHPRVGGRATAAVIAHSISGMIGFAAALVVFHFAVGAWGAAVALLLGLAIAMLWNLLLFAARRRGVSI